jgi:hypothetical protein
MWFCRNQGNFSDQRASLLAHVVLLFSLSSYHTFIKQYLSDSGESTTMETLVSAKKQALACQDGYSSSTDACFSTSSKEYFREWRLWNNVDISDEWPQVHQERKKKLC